MPATVSTLAQNYDIDLILPDLMVDEMEAEQGGDPLLEALPPTYDDFDAIRWNQYENGYGLLGLRGLGGEPDVVQVPGFREYTVAPGYYGERAVLDETEMTKDRRAGTANLPADPEERLAIMTAYQADKGVARLRKTASDFLLTGKFRNTDAAGKVIHADQIENYRTFATGGSGLGAGWAADPTNAKPLNDLKYVQNQLQIGTSSRFGPDSKILCQDGVIVDLLATTQIQSVYKSKFGSTPLGMEGVNELLVGMGLPKLVPYNYGYFNTLDDAVNRTTANFTRIMPAKSMIWLGTRPKGQKIGRWALTRNVPLNLLKGNQGMVENRSAKAWATGIGISLYLHNRLPFRYELDVWFNGGPVLEYGTAAAGFTYT
ncbi:hypothetical protein [Gemmata sp.]|uniref:hypothetical protein n=1 Tax=Gemmata sp. TaxID=1914242 RepID=UPI003F700C92